MNEALEAIYLQLGQLTDEASRKKFLAARPELVNLQSVKDLAEAVRVAVRVNVRKALTLSEAALAIAHELQTNEALAFASRAKANAMWFMGECRPAVELFDTASALFEREGDQSELGRTLSSSLQSLGLLGEYERCYANAERAKEIFSALGESLRLARLEINVANILHRQNRYAEALAAYESAYRKLLPHRDMESIGVALHNMAVCLIALDDFAGALDTYRRVKEFCSEHDMPLLVAQADYNIAYLHYLRGDYTLALELLRSTRSTYRDNSDSYHTALCDLDQSEIYLELGIVDEAAEMAQNSLAYFEEAGMGFESARSLTNLAIAVNAQGDTGRALALFTRAKEIVRCEDNQVWPSLIDLYRSTVLFAQNETAEATALCQSTLTFFRNAHMPGKYVVCLLLLGRASLEAGKTEEAMECCRQALRILEDLDVPLLLYQARLLEGNIHYARKSVDEAYDAYRSARSALEGLRSSLQRDELKIGFLRNRLDVYEHLVRLCLDRGESESSFEEALSYIEAAKSRTLRDFILSEAQPERGDESDALNNRIAELRRELNWYYHRLEREQLSQEAIVLDNVRSLTERARRCEHDLVKLLREAPASGTVGSAIRYSDTVTLEQIRAVLGPAGALLEYFSIEDHIHVAVITAQSFQILPLAPVSGLGQRFRMLQFQLSKFRLNDSYVSRFQSSLLQTTQSHLRAFHKDLIQPILGSITQAEHLVIVPFGPLHSLPFHALLDGDSYLVDRYSVSYAPSASIFAHSHRRSSGTVGPSLILGLDDPAIPFVQEEVNAVASTVPDPLLVFGEGATHQVLKERGATARLVHIASHGYFRQDNPMFSSIRLADSFVTLYDLYRMNLPVDLLTLSGCVTGLNVILEGDEMVGLTRGLMYAGAQSLLLSLWNVNDRSTSEFMKAFYTELQKLPRKSDALRIAMQVTREQFPHPYHWAPFKLISRGLS